MRKFKKFLIEKTFDFKYIDGPRTKKVRGGIVAAPGNSPEDALKHYYIKYGHKNINITKSDGVLKVTSQATSNPQDKEINYYILSEDFSNKKQVRVPAKEFDKDQDAATLAAVKKVVPGVKGLKKLKVIAKTASGAGDYYNVEVEYSLTGREPIKENKILKEGKKQDAVKSLIVSLSNFEKATRELGWAWEEVQGEGIDDDEWCYVSGVGRNGYPFERSFDELSSLVQKWVRGALPQLKKINTTYSVYESVSVKKKRK